MFDEAETFNGDVTAAQVSRPLNVLEREAGVFVVLCGRSKIYLLESDAGSLSLLTSSSSPKASFFWVILQWKWM